MLYKNNSPGKLTQVIPLLTCIRKVPAPNVGDDTNIMTEIRWHYAYLKPPHSHFFPYPSQSIIRLLLHHSQLYRQRHCLRR
jgi:hypothetical protein